MVIQLGKSINSSSIFDEKAEQNASLPQVLPRETACTSSNSCSNVPSSKVPIESKTVQSHRLVVVQTNILKCDQLSSYLFSIFN